MQVDRVSVITLKDLEVTKSTEKIFEDCHLNVISTNNAYIMNEEGIVVGGIFSSPERKVMIKGDQAATNLFFEKINSIEKVK